MTRKIIDYTLVQTNQSLQFEGFVTKALSEGWHPYGHTQIFKLSETKLLYVQPMVKYEEEPVADDQPKAWMEQVDTGYKPGSMH